MHAFIISITMNKKKCILTYVIVEVGWLYLIQPTPVLESKYGSTEMVLND